MRANLEVLFAPAEFAALKPADLAGTVCVVFDVLRATTSMVTALAAGATAIYPVKEIAEAVALRARKPTALLAGERDGVRILTAQTGAMDFDLGNSPREFTPEKVSGREIIITTTNGTRALQACKGADTVLTGALINLSAVAAWLKKIQPPRLLIICAGTYEEAAYEDVWAAGALVDLIWNEVKDKAIADSALMARQIHLTAREDDPVTLQRSRNARRLLEREELKADVPYCWKRDTHRMIGVMRGETIVAAK